MALTAAFGDGAASRVCSPEGEIVWEKGGPDCATDLYKLCHAPALVRGGKGASGEYKRCDKDSYFMVDAPRFCCKNPRLDIAGSTQKPKKREVCGDLLADYDPEEREWRVIRGPSSTGTPQQLAQLQKAGLGDAVPSPLALKATQYGKSWRPIRADLCQGARGTIIAWTNSDPPGKTEFCPSGTAPVRGKGWASWYCDGFFGRQEKMHCCTVDGKLRCVPHFEDETNSSTLRCSVCEGLGNVEAKRDVAKSLKQSSASWAAGLVMTIVVQPSCSAGACATSCRCESRLARGRPDASHFL